MVKDFFLKPFTIFLSSSFVLSESLLHGTAGQDGADMVDLLLGRLGGRDIIAFLPGFS